MHEIARINVVIHTHKHLPDVCTFRRQWAFEHL